MKNLNIFLSFITSVEILWVIIGNVEGIVGGNKASPGQFKHPISIHASKNHICGAAIISDQHVLTAAHCFINSNDLFINVKYILLGGTNNFNDNSIPKIEMKVDKIYVPREYTVNTPDPNTIRDTGDIAVVKLKNKLELNPNSPLKKLNLPEISSTYDNYINKNPIVTGFGIDVAVDNKLTYDGFKDNSGILKYAKTTVISNAECNNFYKRSVQEKHLCAQIEQRDALYPEGNCDGDSGNPLILNGFVIGVLGSSPLNCNERQAPAIYTRVTSFLSFIHEALNDEDSTNIRVATYRYKRKGFGIFEKFSYTSEASS